MSSLRLDAQNPQQPPLSPAQRARIRRLSAAVESEPGDEGGELNVVPYLDIIMNVMMFVLATVTVAFATTITASAANASPTTREPPRALHLTAMVSAAGVTLKTAEGAVAPGCASLGPGVTVPRSGGAHDLVGLSACARRVKAARPAFADERQVTVTASPDVSYDIVVQVMDALRSDADGPLFPEVTLGVVR